MKKYILKLFLLSCLLFLGTVHSYGAQAVTVANNTTSITASPLTSQLNALLYEIGVTSTGGTNAKPNTMTITATTNPSLETGSITLYTYTSATFPGVGTATPLVTIANPTTSMVFNFAAQTITTGGSTQYFFLVENFSRPTTAGTIAFKCTTIDNAAGTLNGNSAYPAAGAANTWVAAVPVTYAAYNTPSMNGLPANPISTTQSMPTIYGFSLTGGAAGTATAINQLTFTDGGTTGGANSNFFANIALYSSTTNNFTGAGNMGSASVLSVASDGTTVVTFTGLNLTVSPSTTTYYFIVVTPMFTVSAVSDYKLNYTSNSGTMGITAGAATNGYDYTITPPTYTIVNNNSNIQPATTPYYYGSTGDVLESIGVSSTSAGVVFNSFTLGTYIGGANSTPYTNYFSNLQLFSSPTANYATAVATGGSAGLTAVTFTNTGTTTNPIITLGNAQALGTTPLYYFLVADFTAGDNLFTNTTTATTFQFELTAGNATYSTGTAAATNTFPVNCNKYNLLSPIAFGNSTTNNTAGVSLNTTQTQVSLVGFSLTAASGASPQTVNTISFSANIVPSTTEIGGFFSNVILYSNTTDNAGTATAVPVGSPAYTVSSLNGKTFTISGLSLNVTSTAVYYYVKADFTAPTNFSSTFQLSATNCTTTTPLTCTAGTPVAGTLYNISPPVILGNATATGLAANPIVQNQNGNTLAIFGFSVFTGPANTFTTFNLSSVQPSGQYLGTNFSGYALYVNTSSNSLTGATLVSGATFSSITASTTLTISGLSQAIPAGKTYYYFIEAVFSSPAIATTYQLNLNSVATSTTTYTTGGPVNGINYTLSGPLGVYYWQASVNRFGGVTSDIWENANNWLNASSGMTGMGYPGQTLSTDVAVFSGSNIKYNLVVITASEKISQMLVSIDNTYSMIVNINNGLTCTVTDIFTVGDPGLVNPVPAPTNAPRTQLILGETNTNGTGQYLLSGTSSIYNDGSVAISGPTTFSSGSTLNLYGTTNDPAFFGVFGYTCTANSVTWNLNGNLASIYTDYSAGSTLLANNSTVNFTGFSAQVSSSGITTFTNCLLNSTTVSNNKYLSGIGCNEGTTTITAGSTVNLGTTSSNGNYNELQCTGGTFNVTGSTVVNMRGPSSYVYNDYVKGPNGAGTGKTPQSIFNVTGSTINLGTSGGSDGSNAQIYNTDAAFFNLNSSSLVNINGANASIYNTSGANNAGNTGYGVFQAASTSIINPTSTTALVYNNNGASYFTLLSDISGAATIGQLGTGAKLQGKFNVQRYLNGGAAYLRNYTLLSSPVNTTNYTSSQYNSIDLTYLGAQASIPYSATTFYGAFIAGPDASFGGGVHTIPNPIIYLYQEDIAPGTAYKSSLTSGKNVGVISLNTANSTVGTINTATGIGTGSPSSAASLPGFDNATGTVIPAGNGYILYYIDNDARTTAASGTSTPNASTVTATGFINQAQVQLFMWGSRSSNLTDTYGIAGVRLPGITVIGNPYPSTIDLKKVYADNSGAITPTLYQLDKMTEQFDAYNASTNTSSTSLSSEYVGSGLGFYIHVDSTTNVRTFYFQEDQKTLSTTAPVFPPISNFAVTPHGPIADNVASPVTTNNVDQPVNNSGVKTGSAPTNSGAGSALNVTHGTGANTNALLLSQTGTPIVLDTLSFANHILVQPVRKTPAPPASKYKPEAPQPKAPPVPIAIANPAGLHLKFVVDSVNNDEIGVYFNKAWSDKFDKNDAFDMDGNSGKAYLSSYTSDNIRTGINAMGDYTGGKRVKLYVKAYVDGIYQLQMTDIASSFNKSQYSVFLIDNLKKDSLDLTLYKSYTFNYALADTGSYANRFVLAIEHKPVAQYQLLTFAGQKVTPGVQLNWKTKNEANTTTFVLQKLSANNTYAFLDSLTSESAGSYAYVDQHPTLGNNTYRLQQTDGLGKITYSAPVTIGYNSVLPNGGLTIYPNPSRATITITLTTSSIATKVATADIYNTSGTLVDHKVVSSNSFDHNIANYKLGVYIIELKNSNGELLGKSKFVKVE